jgi:serine/threonine-protein kinase
LAADLDHIGSRRRRVAKLLDFGLARRISSMHTTTDVITGTPHYVSPERTSGAPATVESDIYALGVLGYLMLAGSLPFEGTATEILLSHLRTEPDDLGKRRGEPVDVALQALISRALSKDLSQRHPSASAFRYELNNTIDMLELGNRNARTASRGTL